MAIFTTEDRDKVKAAIVKLATDGIATVTFGSETVTVKSIDELNKILEVINADLASGKDKLGLRFSKLVPPGTG